MRSLRVAAPTTITTKKNSKIVVVVVLCLGWQADGTEEISVPPKNDSGLGTVTKKSKRLKKEKERKEFKTKNRQSQPISTSEVRKKK